MCDGTPTPDPGRDWATDFDHLDEEYAERAPEIWREVRGRCPIARTERYGGVWAPLTWELVREIAYDTEHFSNWGAIVGTLPASSPPPVGSGPPITSDPPFHREARRILLPPFAPAAVAEMEDDIRHHCRGTLARLDGAGVGAVVDGAADYAEHIPVGVIGRMLGVPPEDDEVLREFVHILLEGAALEEEQQRANRARVDRYVDALIERERENSSDTLTSYLLTCEVMGRPLSHEHLRGTILLLMVAGTDTTWSVLGATLHHLASHPEHRRRLIEDPTLLPTAVEEFVRAFAAVSMGRWVQKDTVVGGCPMKRGESVLVSYPAAARDPAKFDRPDEVVLDRAENPHPGFGLGRHRCVGSHLARLELRVAIEEWLSRFPDFELADPDAVHWSTGQVRGPRKLPLRIL